MATPNALLSEAHYPPLNCLQRPGSASRRVLSCQEEGDYTVLLDKAPHPTPTLFFLFSSFPVFLLLTLLLSSLWSPVSLLCIPSASLSDSLSPPPRRRPGPFVLRLICLCVLLVITTLRDERAMNGTESVYSLTDNSE